MTYQEQNNAGSVPPGMVQVPVKVKPAAEKPIVTYVLIGVTVFVYVIQWLSQRLLGQSIDLPFILGGKVNELILQGQVWRLLTPVFLHGNLLHIAFNMYALYVLGPSLERFYGHWRFLLLYMVAGFAGNVLSFLLSPNPALGASTAIFGLVAAQAVFILRNKGLFGTRARSMLMNLGMIIVVNLLLGLQPGIDNFGHLGGLAGGALFAWFGGPLLKVQPTSWGYELADVREGKDILLGVLLSAGVFLAAAIAKILAG